MKLENWSIGCRDPYIHPDLQAPVLQGNVYEDVRGIEDGKHIYTSQIIKLEGRKVRTRSGSLYELGGIDPAYEAAYPKAEERFFANFDSDGNLRTPPNE